MRPAAILTATLFIATLATCLAFARPVPTQTPSPSPQTSTAVGADELAGYLYTTSAPPSPATVAAGVQ